MSQCLSFSLFVTLSCDEVDRKEVLIWCVCWCVQMHILAVFLHYIKAIPCLHWNIIATIYFCKFGYEAIDRKEGQRKRGTNSLVWLRVWEEEGQEEWRIIPPKPQRFGGIIELLLSFFSLHFLCNDLCKFFLSQ